MPIERLNPMPRWSDATRYAGFIHLVEVPERLDTGMAGQVRQVLTQAEATLARMGSDKSRLLMATIYVVDAADVPALNAEWEAWLPPGCAPARACVKVALLDPAMRVEIAFVAAPGEAA
ncbi:RidA family protein [Chitiniphilus purpureus]|uniref:RidA family protein n=1 Tax=Chitiniphilus purpureus TaxID=2981137 RepID=A0ABY6DNL1_9NEIS|nr:RidA family protein [Chitiniphilus sp. CD1]UXY15071.1 RidA family protein [Chitiniphilus sp. CD1]